ncbi:MAG: hypothetical protein HYV42_01625 [Candidatus Magasanikbacteria bacterium]|nr:hypothetical protein [Candidatus Magasanikbacteria bacterium]
MRDEITFGKWWHGLTAGQQQAWAQKIHQAAGGDAKALEKLDGVIRDELTVYVTFKDGKIVLVDRNGRCIPLATMKGGYVDANRDFYITKPEISYTGILARLQRFFAPEMKFVSAAEFKKRATALIAGLREDQQVANLLKGVYLPIVLPQITVADYGRTLEGIFLAAVERAYQAQYPDREFNNYRKGELAGQVGVVEESRHQRLIEKMAEGPVVLIHFPCPCQGFSIPADRKMIGAFPAGFMLSGALDTATSIVANTSTLALNGSKPGNDCSANTWQSAEDSLSFETDDDGLVFGSGDIDAYAGFSAGLSFVG